MADSQKGFYDARRKSVGDNRKPPPSAATETEGNDNQQLSSMRKRQEERQIEKNRLLQEQTNNLKNIVWGFHQQYREAEKLLKKLEQKAEYLTGLQTLTELAEYLARLQTLANVAVPTLTDVAVAEQKLNQAKRRKQQNTTMSAKRRRTKLRVHGKQFVAPNKL